MADNDSNHTEKSLITQDETAASTSSSEAKQRPHKKEDALVKHPSHGLLWFFVLLTLLIALGVGAAGYWFVWKKQGNQQALINTQTEQQDKLSSLNADNAALQRQIAELERSKEALNQAVVELDSKSEQLRQQTEHALAEIQDMEGRRPSDWLIAEADYLVRMAGRKVWLEKDIPTAILLLKNADARLQELSDPSVIPVRAKIAEDLQRLQQVSTVDRTSLALTLSGILSQVDNLPLDTFERPKEDTTSEALSDSVSDWRDNLKKVWHAIVDDFISIKRTDQPVEPLMTEQEQWLAKEQLKLQLMQAQSAALASNSALFKEALRNANDLLAEEFDTDTPAVNGVMSTLAQLIQTDVSDTLPDSLSSATPLKHLLENRVDGAYGEQEEAL